MTIDPFKKQLEKGRSNYDLPLQFRQERVEGKGLAKSQWPAVVDSAALDLVYGIALGHTQQSKDIGGTIDRHNFPEAAGAVYHEGLRALAGNRDGTVSAIQQFDGPSLTQFSYRINNFREILRREDVQLDIDRGIEALLEKLSTDVIDHNAISEIGIGTKLEHRSSVADLLLQLFSDPEIEAFGRDLLQLVNEEVDSDSLIEVLDRPQMTTVLWEHQREALREWVENDRMGYVDMATATGKTVLGLAAIALQYGSLHPHDQELVVTSSEERKKKFDIDNPRILIVAGNEILLKQWHRQFDEHLDIPPERTEPKQFGSSYEVKLDWGKIEFQTGNALSQRGPIGGYDLVLLDEAHSYTRGSRANRGWRDVFDDLAKNCNSILAMSGSIQTGWQGDTAAQEALETHLTLCHRYGIDEARNDGIIADFDWEVRYAPTPQADSEGPETYSHILKKYIDLSRGKLALKELGIELEESKNEFPSHNDLRSFVQTKEGSNLRNTSPKFDLLSTALLTRRTSLWNLSVTFDAIRDILIEHRDEKTLILCQSYEEAMQLQNYLLHELTRSDEIVALQGRDDNRDVKIQEFNSSRAGVLIGPGKLLGTGIDLPDAKVAINIAQGNVSTSLVQRIGRVLRNPTGDKYAKFYHLVPQPVHPEVIIPREDGHRLLLQAAEFHSLGRSIGKTPEFGIHGGEVQKTIKQLEHAGAEQLSTFIQLQANISQPDTKETIKCIIETINSSSKTILATSLTNLQKMESTLTSANSSVDYDKEQVTDQISEDDLIEIEWLENTALNTSSDESSEILRLRAVERLAEFERASFESLKRIANEEYCDNQQIRSAAQDLLDEIT